MKNELKYLVEWVEYHLLLGVDHIYLASNDCNASTVESASLLQPYVAARHVTLLTRFECLTRSFQVQMASIASMLLERADKYVWVLSIDLDEFVVIPLVTDDIGSVLRRYQKYDSVALLWQVFGTSGHSRSPSGSVLANYQWHTSREKAKDDRARSFKSAVQRARCAKMNVNSCARYTCESQKTADPNCGCNVTPDKKLCVDKRNIRRGGTGTKVNVVVIWLNHYRTKSAEDWEAKKNRGRLSVPENHQNSHRTGPAPGEYNAVFDNTIFRNVHGRIDQLEDPEERRRLRQIFQGVGPMKKPTHS
jgi:hypothetical protein